jgi:hypothetical protein
MEEMEESVNFSINTLQQKGHSALCNLIWVFRLEFWVNIFLHIVQEKGRYPVCILRCFLGWIAKQTLFTYFARKKSFSSVCSEMQN